MASDVGLFLKAACSAPEKRILRARIASQMQQIRTRITTSPAVAPIERKLIERVDLYLHRFDRRMGEAECSGFSPSSVYTLFGTMILRCGISFLASVPGSSEPASASFYGLRIAGPPTAWTEGRRQG